MKKFLPLVGLLALIACKKGSHADNEPIQKEDKKIAVNFGISGFTETTTGFSNSKNTINGVKAVNGSPLTNTSISKVMLIIYDANGNQVSRFEQTPDAANKTYRIANDKKILSNTTNGFGTVTDTLLAGNYTIVAIGAPSKVSLNRKNEGVVDANNPLAYPVATLANAKLWSDYYAGNEEYYYYKGTLNVTDGNAPTQAVELKHIVGEISLVATDSIPKNAVKASFIVRNEASSFRINTSAPEDKFADNIVPVPFDITKLSGKLTITTDVLNTVTPVTVEVKIYDINNNVIISKSIANITVPVSKIITLTGNLFTGYTNPTSTIAMTGDGNFTFGDTIHF